MAVSYEEPQADPVVAIPGPSSSAHVFLEELRGRADSLRSELATVERLIADIGRILAPVVVPIHPPRRRHGGMPYLRDMLVDALRERGEPATVPELRNLVRVRFGYGVGRPAGVIYAALYNCMDRKPEVFQRIEGSNRWALVVNEAG